MCGRRTPRKPKNGCVAIENGCAAEVLFFVDISTKNNGRAAAAPLENPKMDVPPSKMDVRLFMQIYKQKTIVLMELKMDVRPPRPLENPGMGDMN